MPFGYTLHSDHNDAVKQCPDCGTAYMRRLYRRGFMQTVVLALLGFYPWECPVCRKPHYYKERHQKRQNRI